MSGLYGPIPIEDFRFTDGKVSFKAVFSFGEREFELSFQGGVTDSQLTGELTTPRGTRKVTGTKVVRERRRRPQRV